jgi:hypothetical protein
VILLIYVYSCFRSSSVNQLPKIAAASNAGPAFTRDLMSNSLPKLPARTGLPETKIAWGSPTSPHKTAATAASPMKPESNLSYDKEEESHQQQIQQSQALQKTNPMFPLQADGIISAGLMRIVDQLARKLLPWQAVICPKAVETLQDLRISLIQTKHSSFMASMKGKLEEKVASFMKKKQEEVDIWLDREITIWQQFLVVDEEELTDFIKKDVNRLTNRAIIQEQCYRRRELQIANDFDDHERDATREQLVNFRRIVRASKNPLPGGNSVFAQAPKHVEVRVLQETISKAQNSMTAKSVVDSMRSTVRKIEESHDWLCSLADNAITAQVAEEKLKELYAKLDGEKNKSMDSLQNALMNYKEQHNSILEAITVFAGRIHQHASDYLQREQLITRAFLSYLMAIISGEIKSHTQEQKKSSYAWEIKSLTDREIKKEQILLSEFHQHINPLDRMVNEFKEKMRLQMEHITMKLQSIVNGKENDINEKKALIHRKLAKHVNKACNARRQRLKNSTAMRRDEFELESLAMMRVNELTTDLRASVDSVWVKEHLKERKIYEASMGRLERLEKSALIIWNKHSHLAVDTKEDYTDWLENYKKDRDLKIMNHKYEIDNSYLSWREEIGMDMKKINKNIRFSFQSLISSSLTITTTNNNSNETTTITTTTLEETLLEIKSLYDSHHSHVVSMFHEMKEKLEDFIKMELSSIDSFNSEKKEELLSEYQNQLFRLDTNINRRIGGLKDMEADLEETIRLTILQHEIENNIFEQLSCSRMEKFWIDWSFKMSSLGKDLLHTQEDYEKSKQAKKAIKNVNKKVSNSLTATTKETMNATIGNQVAAVAAMKGQKGSSLEQDDNDGIAGKGGLEYDSHEINPPPAIPPSEGALNDTMRIRVVLDDIKGDLYQDFNNKVTRGLEKIKIDLGEGRKQLIPLYAFTKVLAINCDRFYEKTRLNERCIGRISSGGILLYSEGLPIHAKHKFILGTVLSLMAILPIKEYKVDCDDIFIQLPNMKVYFMIGLLTIINSYNEFGEYFIRSECLWMCSVLEIIPPEDLLMNSLAKGLKEAIPETFTPNGIFSEDPVDLYNSLIELPTDRETVEQLARTYQSKLHLQQQQKQKEREAAQQLLMEGDERPGASGGGGGGGHGAINIFEEMASYHPLKSTLHHLEELIPLKDCIIFAALLGRPEGSMEYTTHRICQVISIWRRVSIAMINVTLSPPSSEYPKIKELIISHNNSIVGRKRTENANIHCISPFAAVSSAIDYLTSIQGLPLSILQALAILSRTGSCDPWLEDPKQSFRHERLINEISEMLELYPYRIPKSMIHDELLQLTFPKKIYEILQSIDLNYSNMIPLEAMRTFLQRDDLNLTNGQISMIFWSLCRQNESNNEEVELIGNQGKGETSLIVADEDDEEGEGRKHKDDSLTFNTGGGGVGTAGYRPIVATEFLGDPEKYMIRFGDDVDRYLHSMPSIDSNVILGYLTSTLSSTSAYEIVSDAMKLDAASRNSVPSSCCLWIGSKIVNRDETLKSLILPGSYSKDGNYLIGVTDNPLSVAEKLIKKDMKLAFLLKLRAFIEVDILSKFPEISEIRLSDRHYGPAIRSSSLPGSEEYHWKELLNRRLQRLDRLTKSWRSTMLSEWSESLYISRQMRYQQRIGLIQKSVSVYHTQYHDLREVILQERSSMISMYRGLENELITLIQDDYSLVTYHTSFIDRLLRRFEGEYDRFWYIVREMMLQYLRHISSIKRYGIEKINAASARLKADLDASCSGLITGYTTGFAQGYFDELIFRGEIWRNKLTELHGQLIIIKEHFMFQKDEIDRDLTIQITDRLTVNRQATKNHLQSLSDDSSLMLEQIINTKTSYAALQKDANTRLILRIEKAIRESRKLRNAAEQQPEIEEAVLRDIRHVLGKAKTSCLKIVDMIKENCLKQLHSLKPIRIEHRQKMEKKIEQIRNRWKNVETILYPLIHDYEKEVHKQLSLMNVKAIEMINVYCENELISINGKYQKERILLIGSFRKHFREYDLNELTIFEQFNHDVTTVVQEMIRLWGPSRPKFITSALKELQNLTKESLTSSYRDIKQSSLMRSDLNDIFILSRMELADQYHFTLSKSLDCLLDLPSRFIKEKEETLQAIDEMSLSKNGDMVRPQVKAVMDLLISGIELDYDFRQGYDNLLVSTKTKTTESFSELSEFIDRYNSSSYPVSIPQTIDLTHQKIQARKDEVNALIDASTAHVVADHSKLDVLFTAGEKDIEEWTSLTLQLIENAFHNAELNYLSNLWPTPEPTPRALYDSMMGVVGDDEDRVGKLKEMISKVNQSEYSTALVPRSGGGGSRGVSKEGSLTGYDIALNSGASPSNLANYTGDMKLLLQNLALSAEEEEEERLIIEEKKQEKARLKQQQNAVKEAAMSGPPTRKKSTKGGVPTAQGDDDNVSVMSDLRSLASKNADFKELKTYELQQGWFECHSPEGYVYYHNPETQESLWDLPLFLKKRKNADHDEDNYHHNALDDDLEYEEDFEGGKPSSLILSKAGKRGDEIEKLMDTPRELLLLEGHMYPPNTIPIRVVPEEFRLVAKIDRKVVMSEVTEEARAITALSVGTAVDITGIIYGRKGKDEQTIATLLGDRYNPDVLEKYREMEAAAASTKSAYLDELLKKHMGEEDKETNEYENYLRQETLLISSLEAEKQSHIEQSKLALLNEKGLVITDENGDAMMEKTNAEVDELLMNLGLGSALENSFVMDDMKGGEEGRPKSPVDPSEWLALGLGDKPTNRDLETDSSDGEEYTGIKSRASRLQTTEEIKYLQTKELEAMHKEDIASIMIENFIENENCQMFLEHLSEMKANNMATQEDKTYLLELSKKIRLINIFEIFKELAMNWERIDILIKETIIKQQKEKELKEEIQTKEGLKRQQYIIEHNEDILEMMKFLTEKAFFAKTLAKRMSTDLILRNISTPKKLAKVWQRQEVSLQQEYDLDDDDSEELDKALMALLVPSQSGDLSVMGGGSGLFPSPSASHSFYQPAVNVGGGNYYDPSPTYAQQQQYHSPSSNLTPSVSFSLPASNNVSFSQPQQQKKPSSASMRQQLSALNLQPSIEENVKEEDEVSDEGKKKYPADASLVSSIKPENNFNIDPTWVTEVTEEGGDAAVDDDGSFVKQQQEPAFTYTKDGYKSFRGGWVEGISEKNEIYYYNVKTGASSWHLPDLLNEEASVGENTVEGLIAAAGGGEGEDSGGVDASSQAVVPYEEQYQYDYYQYNNDTGENNDLLALAQGSQVSQQQQQYDPAYDQQQPIQPYYDDSQNACANYANYDENAGGYYDPNNDQQGYYDENGEYQYYPYTAEAGAGADEVGYNESYDQQQQAALVNPGYHTDGNWKMSDALGIDHIVDYVPPPKPRAIPTFQTLEVQAYAKKEGTSHQMVLLQTQDRWQNALVKTQHFITESKTSFIQKRKEMFDKVSQRVEVRLNAFVEDIKFMQKSLKKELGDATATERDLRRVFEDIKKQKDDAALIPSSHHNRSHASLQSQDILRAEKLSFILESLEKFKMNVSEKYESAFKQVNLVISAYFSLFICLLSFYSPFLALTSFLSFSRLTL